MRTGIVETFVGLFILAGLVALMVLAFQVSGLTIQQSHDGYNLSATFDNIGGLKVRAPVTVAGVRIGQVTSIKLDATTYKAIVCIHVDSKASIPTDSAASILTSGLLGANYISITPGYDETALKNNDKIEITHPALILENLIGQLLFSLKGDKEGEKKS